MEEHRDKNGDLPRTVSFIPDSRSQHNIIMKKFKRPVMNRLFANKFVWDVDETGDTLTYIMASTPRNFPLDGEEAKAIKEQHGDFIIATSKQLNLVKRIADNVCEFTYINTVDVGGRIPQIIMNRKISEALDLATRLYERFERRGRDVDAEVSRHDGILGPEKEKVRGWGALWWFLDGVGFDLTPPPPPIQRSVKHS